MTNTTNIAIVYRTLSSRRAMGVPEISAKTGIARRQVRSILNKLDGVFPNENWTLTVRNESPLWRREALKSLDAETATAVKHYR